MNLNTHKKPGKMRRTIKCMKLSLIVFAASALLMGCSGNGKSGDSAPWLKDYAAELVDQGLYSQAAENYEKYLLTPGLADDKKANIHYMMGDLYREKIHDYDAAMANYLKVKYLAPNSPLKGEVDKKVIECLEKTGRSTDARRELDKTVSAEPKTGGDVVASVGGRDITTEELDGFIERQGASPATMQKSQKKDLLKNYIANELMANASVRKGYDRDKELIQKVDDYKRAALAQKTFLEEVGSRVRVDQEKAKLVYDANKDAYKDEEGNVKTFEQVAQEIYQKLYMEEQQKVAQEYITRLLSAEKVEIFDDKITGAQKPADPYEENKLQQ